MRTRYPAASQPSTPRAFRGLVVQTRVIHALMLREALRTHGHHNIGFFWIIGEPMFLMVGIMILWSIAHITHGSDVAVIPFALTGYAFLTLWRHIASLSVRIMRRNVSITWHRHVNLFDAIVARSVLETLSLFTTFVICYIPLYLVGQCPWPNDPFLIVGGFVLTGWFAFGFGLILAALSELNDAVHNVIGAVMYITLPLTGAFTMQEWLPPTIRTIMAWSPLVNCIEVIRGGVFSEDVTVHWSASYLFVCCSLVMSLGLLLCSYAQRAVSE